jgi:D-glycero-D-manno-heptose 1,7-bisphosphate phosphatase
MLNTEISSHRTPAIFLDRDGTLIEDVGYMKSSNLIKWLPKVQDTLKIFVENKYLLVVITNQSGIARGILTEKDVISIHSTMNEQILDRCGVVISKFYYCPHHPDAIISKYQNNCLCRKPGALLFNQAIRELNINVEKSMCIGDKLTDLTAANAAGIKKLFLLNNIPVKVPPITSFQYKTIKSWDELQSIL